MAQEEGNTTPLPYHTIPDYPEEYSAGTLASRMIDGLGFRYYWATEGLRQEDLDFAPGEDARTTFETLEHIHGLCKVILNAAKNEVNERGPNEETMDFVEMRKETLLMLSEASQILRESDDLNNHEVIFKRGERSSQFPFWNLVNGPIADAIWHVGQVVTFRRSSGNPFPAGVSVFMGSVRQVPEGQK